MSRDLSERVRHDRYGVGDFRNFKVKDDLLPTIPPEVEDYASGAFGQNLFLHGPHGTGKTWMALWAARVLISQGVAPSLSYWTEPRFAKDRDTLMWFRKCAAGDVRSDSLWTEFSDYEVAYCQFTNSPLLMIDDVGYWGVGTWQTSEMWQLIKARCENDLPTIVVAKTLPESDSPEYSVAMSHFMVVQVAG